jgi:hypothetical protein
MANPIDKNPVKEKETIDYTHNQDKDLEKIRHFRSSWKNFFDYWKKRGVEQDPYKGTILKYPQEQPQQEEELPIQDFGTYDKAKQNAKLHESFDEFINEAAQKIVDYSNSKSKILVGLKTDLLRNMKERYKTKEDGDSIYFFDKSGNHFGTLFDLGSRYQELRHNGKLDDYGYLKESNSNNEVEMILSKDQDFDDVKRLLRTDKKANHLNFTHWSHGQPLGSIRGHLITLFFDNPKSEVTDFIQRNDIKIANKSYFDL